MNISVEQNHIKTLSLKRYEYIKKREDSYDEKSKDYTLEEPKEIDEIGDKISECIKKWRNQLTFEFIIDELTKLGGAPCLLYDDNGHFAISGEGYAGVSMEPSDIHLSHLITKDMWKDSIREALDYYLDNDDN